MKLYIAGPMAGLGDHNRPAFNEAEANLLDAGYEVVNPSILSQPENWKHRNYMARDLPIMLQCDGVATLPDITHSRGMRAEVTVAQCCSVPVRAVDDWILRKKHGLE